MFVPSYLAYLWILAAHSSATAAVPGLSPLPMVMTYTWFHMVCCHQEAENWQSAKLRWDWQELLGTDLDRD